MFNNNVFITEQNVANWSNMISEQFEVTDKNKLAWVSEVAAIHEAFEAGATTLGVQGTNPNTIAAGVPSSTQGVSPIYSTPLNTIGMGQVMAPENPATARVDQITNFYNQGVGSGDIPLSTLPMALNVALQTIGLELVPVVPSKGPWQMLSYLDFPYAGGKIGGKNMVAQIDGVGKGKENKPLYVKFIVTNGDTDTIADFKTAMKTATDKTVTITSADGVTFKGIANQWGRMDGALIVEVTSCQDANGDDCAILDLFKGSSRGNVLTASVKLGDKTIKATNVDYVQTSVDLIDGYANFATGGKNPMTRAENETGTGNVIGLRTFTKWVEMGSYEVTGSVTRQQLQDLPLYGIDVVSDVMQAMQNELTQHINQRILDALWRLGVTNAANQLAYQGLNLNVYCGIDDSKDLADFGVAPFVDVNGVDRTSDFKGIKTGLYSTNAENLSTIQRRIASRCLAAANVIYQTSRRGRGTFIVTNAQVASALQDVSGYVVAPFANTLSQTTDSLYHAGTLGGLQVYVDPYMAWDDTRILVGRKGAPKEPGLIFMPYILADKVSIVAEGTMAQKMLVNSRFAVVPVGFYPEASYITFAVNSDSGQLV